MKLNCRPGQLAVKVKADPWDEIPEGAIVRCINIVHGVLLNVKTGEMVEGAWNVEFRGSSVKPGTNYLWICSDAYLRPIRDTDGEDETLSWANVPKETACLL